MSNWRGRDGVALTGVDCFLRALEHEVRRFHGASHLSQLVLRLGAGFDLDGFRALIAEVARAAPIVRAPVRRPLGVAPPVYDVGRARAAPPPSVSVLELPRRPALTEVPVDERALVARGDAGLPATFRERLNGRFAIERGELLHCDVVRYAGGAHGTDLAITWAHLLLDGVGSERFVRRLDDCFRGRARVGDIAREAVVDAPAPELVGAARLRAVRAWQRRMIGFASAAPRSLGGPRRRVAQQLDYEIMTLPEDASAQVTARAATRAGYLTPALFYLAATLRAHDAVFRARGVDPGDFLVTLPVNLRPKGTDAGIFRSNVSLLWFAVPRRTVADLDGLVRELMRQRRAWIADGMIENGAIAMDLVRAAPARLHTWLARRHLGGELASLYFAFTNEFLPGMGTFFGAEIVNGFHVPSVMPSPGSNVVMSLRDRRLNVTCIHQRGTIDDGERALLREQLLADLVGDARALAAPPRAQSSR